MKNLITLIIAVLFCTQLNSNAKTLSLSLKSKNHSFKNFKNAVIKKKKMTSCDLYYSNIAQSASVTDVKFYSGSGLVADYTNPTNNSMFGQLSQGVYTVYVTTTGGSYDPGTRTGFNSVYYYGNGSLGVDCSGHNSVITFTMDLSSSTEAHINMDYGDCN